MQFESVLTCPKCAHQALETMPADACQFFYDCKGCGERLKPGLLAPKTDLPGNLARIGAVKVGLKLTGPRLVVLVVEPAIAAAPSAVNLRRVLFVSP